MIPPLRATSRLSTTASSSLRLHRSPALLNHSLQRPFSSSKAICSGSSHGHEDPYDPPGGWLWGVPPGQKYENEGWENVWTYGFGGCMLFLVVGYCYKPDTSIQTWALEEARRRLEVEGILEDPDAKKS
ncbi:hypothetical protein EV356DRAFT_503995 [Viridothelium virens]|uniref:NADH dehydrogenase [ubiquinone] 1 beta subcomplex subunit 11, mitochondrial n=1 Tax=Viridothelium virens TaxID=1048519 RepID=A0A6A6H5J0_VIRVR|nr:hypothetical protein EV356DRAFT_503995 [Viridothelium virens]